MSLKQDLKSKKLVLGSGVVVKKIQSGKIKKVYVSSNFPKKDELKKMCGLFKVECIDIEEDNVSLGVLCKKPFAISVLGVE